MKKVVVNYDEGTGQITDAANMIVGTYFGLQPVSGDEEKLSVDKICKLKEAGFDHESIIAMHKAKVV